MRSSGSDVACPRLFSEPWAFCFSPYRPLRVTISRNASEEPRRQLRLSGFFYFSQSRATRGGGLQLSRQFVDSPPLQLASVAPTVGETFDNSPLLSGPVLMLAWFSFRRTNRPPIRRGTPDGTTTIRLQFVTNGQSSSARQTIRQTTGRRFVIPK